MAPKSAQKTQKVAVALQATTGNSMLEEVQALLRHRPGIVGQVLQAIRSGMFDEADVVVFAGFLFCCLFVEQPASWAMTAARQQHDKAHVYHTTYT